MTDAISRCELFNKLATIPAPPEANDFKAEVYKVIQQMETVGRWIPCSERLPSGTDTVLVSTCAFDAIYDVVFMMAKDVESFYECGYVNAWMPSPEPWKGADDENY